MCIEPPLPWQRPVERPNSSAYMSSMLAPLAMQCPWPRCVLTIASVVSSTEQTPTATASSPE